MDRYWQKAIRAGHAEARTSGTPPSGEEAERLRQLEMVRRAPPAAKSNLPENGRNR
jgi:hypothetical protein